MQEPLDPHHLMPLAYTVEEAVKVSRVGRNRLYEAVAAGSLRARKIGRRILILRDDLCEWMENLPTATDAAPSTKPRLIDAAE